MIRASWDARARLRLPESALENADKTALLTMGKALSPSYIHLPMCGMTTAGLLRAMKHSISLGPLALTFALLAAACSSATDDTANGNDPAASGDTSSDDLTGAKFPPGIKAKDASALRSLLTTVTTTSGSFRCAIDAFGGKTGKNSHADGASYTFSIEPMKDVSGVASKRDYFFHLATTETFPNSSNPTQPLTGNGTILIDYDPANSPSLKVDNHVFTYDFEGIIVRDRIQVTTDANSAVSKIVYTQLTLSEDPIRSITCAPR